MLHDGEGRNVMRGGPGNDELDSGYFNDVLYGGSGDDDLDGGYGEDRLSGGTGHNICTITAQVTATGCTPDQGPPVADSFTIGRPPSTSPTPHPAAPCGCTSPTTPGCSPT